MTLIGILSTLSVAETLRPADLDFELVDGFGLCNGITVYVKHVKDHTFGWDGSCPIFVTRLSHPQGWDFDNFSERNLRGIVDALDKFVWSLPKDQELTLNYDLWDDYDVTAFIVRDLVRSTTDRDLSKGKGAETLTTEKTNTNQLEAQ